MQRLPHTPLGTPTLRLEGEEGRHSREALAGADGAQAPVGFVGAGTGGGGVVVLREETSAWESRSEIGKGVGPVEREEESEGKRGGAGGQGKASGWKGCGGEDGGGREGMDGEVG